VSLNHLKLKSYTIRIEGIVQGVGYRPYVFNQAKLYSVKGWVKNHGSALLVLAEGEANNINNFLHQIIKKPPCNARIEKVEIHTSDHIGYKEFNISLSSKDEAEIKYIKEDIGICSKCLEEINNTNNVRYHYPFTNCTDCGPRYSIINDLPYDRFHTTMNVFEMCPECHKEYNDPTNRRFHAQPNCCPNCGPSIFLLNREGNKINCKDPLKETIKRLESGYIIGIKGLGGFHFACNAENTEGIRELRIRKKRPHKPFAIMVKDINMVKQFCYINEIEEGILLSNKKPIVLLEKKETCQLPDNLAPNYNKLGIMLPYTPLHALLFQESMRALVLTSGNISSAPIEYENSQATSKLKNVADYFLVHNRDIQVPIEDSVVKVINEQEVITRRARGYTPYIVPIKVNKEILALGAEDKSTFCAVQNQNGYLSQYLGDLKDYDSFLNYKYVLKHMIRILNLKPKLIVHDLHPGYQTTLYAAHMREEKLAVQHHHAHMVSCMVEHHLYEPVIGVIFDGTGYGLDGRIWGGEFFVGTRANVKRVGHFKYVKIQGGDYGIKEPWRIALSYLYSINSDYEDSFDSVDEECMEFVKQGLEQNINCFETSSVGRLFDCVSSLVNQCHAITYDSQAAIELENIIDWAVTDSYSFHIITKNNSYQIDYGSILLDVISDLKNKIQPSIISTKFHNTIGNASIDVIDKIAIKYKLNQVVLSGGVFENKYLLLYIVQRLEEKKYLVFYHKQIPTNDSGISIGQVGVAAAIEGMIPCVSQFQEKL
jgi:hydrogenase maturation protein HypF